MAYATYVALADASLQDNQEDAPLFAFLQRLRAMEEGLIIASTNVLKFKY